MVLIPESSRYFRNVNADPFQLHYQGNMMNRICQIHPAKDISFIFLNILRTNINISKRIGFDIATNIASYQKSLTYEIIVCKIGIITSFILANKSFDKRYTKLEFVTHQSTYFIPFMWISFIWIPFSTRRINGFLWLAFNMQSYIYFHLDRN